MQSNNGRYVHRGMGYENLWKTLWKQMEQMDFDRKVVSKTNMFVLETIQRMNVLTAVGKKVFEI